MSMAGRAIGKSGDFRNRSIEVEANRKELAATLKANGWPADADQFVRAMAATWVDSDDPVLPIIRDAFGGDASPMGQEMA
jgi:hypothetical protein